MKISATLLRSAVVAALGGLLFGFDTAVISGTTQSLTEVFQLTPLSLGFTVASALIGTILGALLVGRPADALGRRIVLINIAVIYFVSAIGSGIAWDWYSFLFFRFLGGLGVGGASVVAPMYIAEISPAAVRGRLVALTQFNIVFGILLAFLSNYVLAQWAPQETAWRWMLAVEAVPAALFFLLLFPTPETPRWLAMKGRTAEAHEVLHRLGADADEELARITAAVDEAPATDGTKVRFRDHMRPTLLAVTIAAFNQLSGINALMYYAPQIFLMAGADADSALLQSLAVGGMNLLFTMAALLIIDHFGRRKLMLVGSVGYLISLSVTAWAFYSYGSHFSAAGGIVVLCSLLLFIAAHAFGQGAVIWVFVSEIFPTPLRARGQALGSFTHWMMAAVISWTFPAIAAVSGGHVFAFYAFMMLLQLLWVVFVMPETRGVSLEDMEARIK